MKIYLETSVPNFLFADDSPEKRNATHEFFRWMELTQVKIYTSQVVFNEIADAPSPLKGQMLEVLALLPLELLSVTPKEAELAALYLEEGALLKKSGNDALHAAVCVLHNIDFLASWNMKHLANFHREGKLNAINLRCGLPQIKILTPEQMILL